MGGGVNWCQPAWQQPVGCIPGSHWTPNVQGFPALGSRSIPVYDGRRKRRSPDDRGDVSASGTAKVTVSPLEMGGGQVQVNLFTTYINRCIYI